MLAKKEHSADHTSLSHHILFSIEVQSCFEPNTWLGSALWWVIVGLLCLQAANNKRLCPEPWEPETFPHLFAWSGAGGNRQNLPTWGQSRETKAKLKPLVTLGHMTTPGSSPHPLSSPQVPNTQAFHHSPGQQDRVYVSPPESLSNEAGAGVRGPPPCSQLSEVDSRAQANLLHSLFFLFSLTLCWNS